MTDDMITDDYSIKDIVAVKISDHAELSSCNIPSGPLADTLSFLFYTASQYEKLTDTIVRNASAKVHLVTNKNIQNDFELILIVDNDLDKLKDKNLLDAACDVTDAGRKITGQYKIDAPLLVAKLINTLIPNAEHLNDILTIVASEQRLCQNGQSEKSIEEILKMNYELRTACRYIEMNLDDQMDVLEKELTELALGVDSALKNLVDKISLQMQVNDAAK